MTEGCPTPSDRVSARVAGIEAGWLDALDGVAYLADVAGTVVAVGESRWRSSAIENQATGLTAASAIGRNLMIQISGDEVRALYQRRHAAVIGGSAPAVAFEFRCDAPALRRTMRMSMSRLSLPAQAPMVLYQSQLLSAVARPWMSVFEPERIVETLTAESGVPIIPMCSFCQRLAWPIGQGAWVEADRYYALGGPADVRISHGVCPSCTDHPFL